MGSPAGTEAESPGSHTWGPRGSQERFPVLALRPASALRERPGLQLQSHKHGGFLSSPRIHASPTTPYTTRVPACEPTGPLQGDTPSSLV